MTAPTKGRVALLVEEAILAERARGASVLRDVSSRSGDVEWERAADALGPVARERGRPAEPGDIGAVRVIAQALDRDLDERTAPAAPPPAAPWSYAAEARGAERQECLRELRALLAAARGAVSEAPRDAAPDPGRGEASGVVLGLTQAIEQLSMTHPEAPPGGGWGHLTAHAPATAEEAAALLLRATRGPYQYGHGSVTDVILGEHGHGFDHTIEWHAPDYPGRVDDGKLMARSWALAELAVRLDRELGRARAYEDRERRALQALGAAEAHVRLLALLLDEGDPRDLAEARSLAAFILRGEKPSAVFGVDEEGRAVLRGWPVMAIAMGVGDELRERGVENFAEWAFTAGQAGFTVTVQRADGKAPGQLFREAVEALVSVVDRLAEARGPEAEAAHRFGLEVLSRFPRAK